MGNPFSKSQASLQPGDRLGHPEDITSTRKTEILSPTSSSDVSTTVPTTVSDSTTTSDLTTTSSLSMTSAVNSPPEDDVVAAKSIPIQSTQYVVRTTLTGTSGGVGMRNDTDEVLK